MIVTIGPLSLALFLSAAALLDGAACADEASPSFQVDPFWPKPLPNNWILGQVAGVAVDAQDHVWIIQRPRTLTDDEKGAALDPPRSRCCLPAPAVIEFTPGRCPGLGRARRGLSMAGQRARHLRRSQGLRLDRRQRPRGRPDPEIHPQRQVRAADRP
jgi:hypothetical protein